MRYNRLFLVFAFIFLISLVSAAPPQASLNEEGFELTYPRYEFVESENHFQLNVHVFNKTNSMLIPNTEVGCKLHLYNSTGNHLIKLDMDKSLDTYYHEVDINGGNFTDLGIHAYTIWCNSSNRGGFISGEFVVNPSGFELTSASSIVYGFSLLLITVLFFILLYYGLTLKWENQVVPEDNFVYIDYKKYLKIILLFGAYLTFTFMMAMGESMANELLFSTGASAFFDLALKFALIGIVPTFILTFVFIVIGALSDKKIHDAVSRGLPVR